MTDGIVMAQVSAEFMQYVTDQVAQADSDFLAAVSSMNQNYVNVDPHSRPDFRQACWDAQAAQDRLSFWQLVNGNIYV